MHTRVCSDARDREESIKIGVVIQLLSRVLLFATLMDCSPLGSSVHGSLFFQQNDMFYRTVDLDFSKDSVGEDQEKSFILNQRRLRWHNSLIQYINFVSCIKLHVYIYQIISLYIYIYIYKASQIVLVVKNLPANTGDVRDTGLIPGLKDPLEEGMATHSSILSWRIPWTEEPGRLQSINSQSQTQLKQLSIYT